MDKARSWLSKGAQPTEPVIKLLEIAGVTEPAERRKALKARRAEYFAKQQQKQS